MSTPLTKQERDLHSRFRRLGQRLNDEFGYRGRWLGFSTRQDRRDTVVWRLECSRQPEDTNPPRTACAIAKSENHATTIHLGYSEQWVHLGKRNNLRFKSSNMRFVIASTQREGDTVEFRLEWAARWKNSLGAFEFPGKGAAHPHWQMDLQSATIDGASTTEISIDLSERYVVEDVDLNAPAYDRCKPARWFHKLHLPARAMWHEKPCTIPDEVEGQQHEPKTVDELDNWTISAIRYIQHEFYAYS